MGNRKWAGCNDQGSLLKRVKNFICRPRWSVWFEYYRFSAIQGKEKGTWSLDAQGLSGSPWGSVPVPFAYLPAPLVPLWNKALCVLQEGAHGWLVDDKVAFSGAAKLRQSRGGADMEWGAQAPALPPHEGIMPLLRLRSAMVLRLWLARVALLASFFLRSWVVSRFCPWPRGLPATAVELSCRCLRGKSPPPKEKPPSDETPSYCRVPRKGHVSWAQCPYPYSGG